MVAFELLLHIGAKGFGRSETVTISDDRYDVTGESGSIFARSALRLTVASRIAARSTMAGTPVKS